MGDLLLLACMPLAFILSQAMDLSGQNVEEPDREGQWRRRRRLDGALNRLPPNFYILVWHILERVRCDCGFKFLHGTACITTLCSVQEYKSRIIIYLPIQLCKR